MWSPRRRRRWCRPAASPSLDFGDPVDAVNRVAAELTDGDPANGEADVIVAELPRGRGRQACPTERRSSRRWRKGGEFAEIVNVTSPKVDVIFTGHTHKAYAWDAPIPGQPGKTRPIIQTGKYGTNVGQVV